MIKIYHNFTEYGNETIDTNLHSVFNEIKNVLQELLKEYDEPINQEGGCLVVDFNKDSFTPFVNVKGCSAELSQELLEQIDIIFKAWTEAMLEKYGKKNN